MSSKELTKIDFELITTGGDSFEVCAKGYYYPETPMTEIFDSLEEKAVEIAIKRGYINRSSQVESFFEI